MKGGREHRVPLSHPATAVVEAMSALRINDFVFAGTRRNQPLSNMAMLQLLKRMERGELTAHGFRSTFRNWAAECSNFPREVARRNGNIKSACKALQKLLIPLAPALAHKPPAIVPAERPRRNMPQSLVSGG